VAAVQKGVGMDFEGPGFGVTSEEYNAVVGEFPKQGFRNSLNQTMIWLCQTKPRSTYGTSSFCYALQRDIVLTVGQTQTTLSSRGVIGTFKATEQMGTNKFLILSSSIFLEVQKPLNKQRNVSVWMIKVEKESSHNSHQ